MSDDEPSAQGRAPTGATAARQTATAGAPRVASPPPSSPTSLPAAGVPSQVLIESLDIDATVVGIATEGRSLDPPPDPQLLGWWAEGSRPGAAQGSALITGHTVHDGGGALDDLEDIRAGAPVAVRTAHGVVHYVVETVAILDKDTIARQAPELFSQEVPGRLVLVTCEDWDGTGYRSNVVVTATPLP